MAIYPGFAGGSYESQTKIAAGERCINLFPEQIEVHGKSRAALYPCHGVVDFAMSQDAPGRGLFGESGRLFAVFGSRLEEVSSAGVVTTRGALLNDNLPATFASNGDGELFVTSGTKGYALNLGTNVLTLEVNDVTMGGQVDGFLLGLDTVTGTLKISELLDATTWDPTQIAQRTAASDPWKAMTVVGREIFLFGEKTGEVWYNAGRSPFPFAQRLGAFFEVGIEALFSLAPVGSTLAWLGKSSKGSGIVYQMNGYSPQRISTHAVEWALEQYKQSGDGIDDAIGWSYEKGGHAFYVLEFPTAEKTWVYDATTQVWHERGRWSSIENAYVAYRPRFHAQAFDKNLVCDGHGSKIYELSSSVYTDVGGQVLRRARRFPHLAQENWRITIDYLELECQRGVGLGAGQGSDPMVGLTYSRDGGETWSAERWRSMGKGGDFLKRVRWNSLGSGRDWVPELFATDPVPTRWIDVYFGAS